MMDQRIIENLRRDYRAAALDLADVAADPLAQFGHWFAEALRGELPEPNAMILATADAQGQPSARVLLLKGLDSQGFVFYTNYQSRKAQDLAANPRAAMVFNWLELERQVRIEGRVEKVSAEESTAYFQSRPKGSQIGAHASPQSQPISGREVLEARVAALQAEYAEAEQLPRPEHWGGYRLVPQAVEFWQGRPSRLHDRLRYALRPDGTWQIERLAP